jgi:hypothetical protein
MGAMADKDKASPVGKIRWLDDVADHDYAAAEAYLSLKLETVRIRGRSTG